MFGENERLRKTVIELKAEIGNYERSTDKPHTLSGFVSWFERRVEITIQDMQTLMRQKKESKR